jgi:hypothetical protein
MRSHHRTSAKWQCVFHQEERQGHIDGREHQGNDKPLAGFKRRYRKAEGISRLKRGADIPIAVLVSKVTLRKRLEVEGVVRSRLPRICEAIGAEIAAVL